MLMCNLRAKPDGLETHKKFLYGEIGGWLGHPDEADITFICTAVSQINLTDICSFSSGHFLYIS